MKHDKTHKIEFGGYIEDPEDTLLMMTCDQCGTVIYFKEVAKRVWLTQLEEEEND